MGYLRAMAEAPGQLTSFSAFWVSDCTTVAVPGSGWMSHRLAPRSYLVISLHVSVGHSRPAS